MIFRRKAYDKLLEWKQSAQGKKAVLIEGARRIGKSTLVEEFAKREYKAYLLINFSKVTSYVKSLFKDELGDMDAFFMKLFQEFKVKLIPHESVIIFDEVQKFPRAREAIKFLVEDGRYDYIETGSLISIHENVKDIVIPSEERSIRMYPMDFEEFLWASGEEMLADSIKTAFSTKVPLDDRQHRKAMDMFRRYILVGGMPKAIDVFISGQLDFSAADAEKRDILTLYRGDIMKIKSRYRSKVLAIYDQMPGLLSQHEKRVVLSRLTEGRGHLVYEDTFFWLADSMIANECFACADPNVGLSLNEERTAVKCYMGDTGLLVSHAFDENEIAEEELYRQILLGKLALNEGMLHENVIAQTLVANGHKLYFYTHYDASAHRNDVEIDFLISNGSKTRFKVFPIEVKSANRYSLNSLMSFKERFKQRIGECYVVHPGQFAEKDGIIRIPSYMAMCL